MGDLVDTREWYRSILRAVSGYAFFAALWILVSDRVAGWLFKDPDVLVRVGTAKGWLFVVVTSLLLYGYLKRSWGRAVRGSAERSRALKLLENVAECSEDAIFAKDLQDRYILFNRAASEFVGKPVEDVLGRDDRALFPPAQAEMLMSLGRQVLEEGRTFTREEPLDTVAGKRVFLATKGPLLDADGAVFGVFGVSRDITERKLAEERLLTQKERLGLLADLMPGMLVLLDDQLRYVFVNSEYAKLFGHTAPELVGREVEAVVGREAYGVIGPSLNRALAGERVAFRRELAIPNGGKRVLEVSYAPFHARDIPSGVVGLIIDVTEQARAEASLKESERRLIDAQSIAQVGNWDLDLNTNTIVASEEALRMYGLPAGASLQKLPMIQEQVHPDDRPRMDEAFRQLVGGVPYDEEYRLRPADGSPERVIHTRARLIRDEYGKPVKVQGVIQDVTQRREIEQERKRLEAQLYAAQRGEAIATLAGGIAHDFNNILTPLIGHAELALGYLPKEDPLREDVEPLLVAAMRAADLVKQLLATSRKSVHGAMVLVPLGSLVKEVAKLVRSALPSTIEIQLAVDSACGPVLGDASQLHQVILNLCTNAGYAMRDKGGVLALSLDRIRNESSGWWVRLRVKDTGEGIPDNQISRIFEPYFTTKPTGEGSGLGLAVVHGIVTKSGGTIHVESAPGTGTTFEVLLPESAGENDLSKQELPEAPRGRGERVLVVDDEVAVGQALSRMLTALGYHVDGVASSEEALEKFQAAPHAVDAVVTDQTMPRMSGLTLAGEMIKVRPDLPILLATGFSEGVDADLVREKGLKGLVTKPYTMRTIGEALRQALVVQVLPQHSDENAQGTPGDRSDRR